MTHPTVQRIENAFGSETAKRFEEALKHKPPTYLDALSMEKSVKGIIAGAFIWLYTEEGFSYWCNLASSKFFK